MRELDGRYELTRRIGRGGMGDVYEGIQLALDRRVAIKILRSEHTTDAGLVSRFEQEARTTSRLNHPNVVTVHDVGKTPEGDHFLVMELLEGHTLAEELRRNKDMPMARVLDISTQVAKGMGAGQGVGLVHRDLKPDNLMLVSDNRVKVLDFGLAILWEGVPSPQEAQPMRAPATGDSRTTWYELSVAPTESTAEESGRLTQPGSLLGTPRYMSPEQALGWKVDHRADLYAFGCILFEMIAGRAPFEADSPAIYLAHHVHSPPARLETLHPSVPSGLSDLVHRLLAKDPAARPADWPAVAQELRRVVGKTDAVVALGRPDSLREQLPTEPYRFLQPFSEATRAIFFGRDEDARRFRAEWEHPNHAPLVLLTGASGVGKTSFLYARVVPGLVDTGHHVLVIRGGERPLSALSREVGRLVNRSEPGLSLPTSLIERLDLLERHLECPLAVVLDQLEEIFTTGDDDDRADFQSEVAALLTGSDLPVRFILSLREDYLGPLMRTLFPLPLESLVRVVPLRPLAPSDVEEALTGPGRLGLLVGYPPFSFAEGLTERIVADLLADRSAEVGPRVQAVGHRLWEMMRDDEVPRITADHYTRLGGAQSIVGRTLDEAIESLDASDQGVAKELLRALTHLPGSPTSRQAPDRDLLGSTEDRERRQAILHELESRWRVLHGYADPRFPNCRTYRLAHEALIARIKQYGQETTDRNRARQIFLQGFDLWLQNSRREEDLLPEVRFDLVLRHADELVLRGDDERAFFVACQELHNEGWLVRYEAERRQRIRQRLFSTVVPVFLIVTGFILGQVPVEMRTFRMIQLHAMSATGAVSPKLPGAPLDHANLARLTLRGIDLTGATLVLSNLRHSDLEKAILIGADLRGADLRHASLIGADLTGAQLQGAHLRGTRLHAAKIHIRREDVDFSGAIFNADTDWGPGGPAVGALGPFAKAPGIDLTGQTLPGENFEYSDLTGADLTGAFLKGVSFFEADLTGIRAAGVDLREANLGHAELRGAQLQESLLSGARLHAADLREADLTGASMAGADLRSAILEDTVLRSADLRDANLRGARLCGADLTGAVLTGAELADTVTCATTRGLVLDP
jgi:uncharacterized protein YjbI with pentapeptide repeats/serine/threonine protein kinase